MITAATVGNFALRASFAVLKISIRLGRQEDEPVLLNFPLFQAY